MLRGGTSALVLAVVLAGSSSTPWAQKKPAPAAGTKPNPNANNGPKPSGSEKTEPKKPGQDQTPQGSEDSAKLPEQSSVNSGGDGTKPGATNASARPGQVAQVATIAKAEQRAASKILVPAIRLSGKKDANAEFKVSLPIVVGMRSFKNLLLAPTLVSKTSSGVSTLFSAGEGASAPSVQWGGTAGYYWLDKDGAGAPPRRTFDDWIVAGYDRCIEIDKKKFEPGDRSKRLSKRRSKLCKEGQEVVNILERAFLSRERSVVLYPKRYVSVGALWGRETFSFLDNSSEELVAKKRNKKSRRLAVYGAAVLPGFMDSSNLYLDARFERLDGAKGQSTKAEFCNQVGTVGTAPAEVCKQVAFGAPKDVQKDTVQLGAGLVDSLDAGWRFGIGYFGEFNREDETSTHGLEFPIYLNLVNLQKRSGKFKDAYKGIIRVTPRILEKTTEDGKTELTALVLLELLGQNSLFGQAFD